MDIEAAAWIEMTDRRTTDVMVIVRGSQPERMMRLQRDGGWAVKPRPGEYSQRKHIKPNAPRLMK